jgi:prepilin-type N-terminal cleavage/methylation domain-containing protein
MSRGSRAFTLIEALVAVALVGIGIAAAMGGLARLSASQYRARETERMQRLACQKYDELAATGALSSSDLNGDFADYSHEEYEWQATVEPTGVQDLNAVTITVDRRGEEDGPSAKITGLVYEAPAGLTPTGGQP